MSSCCIGKVLNEFSFKIESLNVVVLKALARSLNLEDDCFLNQYGKTSKINARFNYYPPCPCPEKVLGLKPHGDGSAITFLLQDKEVEGLQLLKDDQWVGVPVVPDALTINVDDQMEVFLFVFPVNLMTPNHSSILVKNKFVWLSN
ncbi:non-heme dioxygenase N-terminal domain-containing protein [Tanacetum coccineum]